jgi:AcrR family transcriptional regulator
MKAPHDSRRRVLDASLALVAASGVRAMSFREVARLAGVSHQTPYHHFGSAQGILRAIAEEGFSSLTAEMAGAAEAAGPDPLDGLTAAGVAYVAFATAHPGHFRVMFQRPVDGAEPPLPEAAATFATLERLVAAAHAPGHGAGVPVNVLVGLCWAVVHGIAALRTEGHGPPVADAEVVRGLGRLLRG